jgi:hypothetical protein
MDNNILKHIRFNDRQLVSLNTARIKLRKNHPRISQDLGELLDTLKFVKDESAKLYKTDGYLDLET